MEKGGDQTFDGESRERGRVQGGAQLRCRSDVPKVEDRKHSRKREMQERRRRKCVTDKIVGPLRSFIADRDGGGDWEERGVQQNHLKDVRNVNS